MPGFDGRGPWGEGPRTGRGRGFCGRRGPGFRGGRGGGHGLWCRRGRGWRWFLARGSEEERRRWLEEEAKLLRERLKEIEAALG